MLFTTLRYLLSTFLRKNLSLTTIPYRIIVLITLLMIGAAFQTACAVSRKPEKATPGSHIIRKDTSPPAASSASSQVSSQAVPQIEVAGVSLNETSINMKIGDTITLSATISPAEANDKTIHWTSSDMYTAKADQTGKVAALASGTAYIYATAVNGIQDKCKVTVSDPVASASSAQAVQAAPATPSVKSFHGSQFDSCSQLVVATVSSLSSTQGTLKTYQKSNGVWNNVLSTAASFGQNGMVYDADRIEGDMKTPLGIYTLPYAFGISANPGTKLTYKGIDTNTYFDGQYGSGTYDQMVEGKPANNEWEYMYNVPVYNYGLLINFNPEQKVGKGNAIFLHCLRYTGSVTAGCVSIDQIEILNLLKWIDPGQNPKILICLSKELPQYYY